MAISEKYLTTNFIKSITFATVWGAYYTGFEGTLAKSMWKSTDIHVVRTNKTHKSTNMVRK